VVAGIGIRPNVTLFEGQHTLDKGGIKMNGKMQTSDRSVYAVGDVVSFPVKIYGDYRKLEHVDHARKSAAHAVQAILRPNKTRDYEYMPSFYSRVFNLSWQFYGDTKGTSIWFGEPEKRKFGAYWVQKGKVVGTFFEGGSKEEYGALMRVARDQPEVEDLDQLKSQGLNFAIAHALLPAAPVVMT
jgi:monodehydroascorbate reductase (NADH)